MNILSRLFHRPAPSPPPSPVPPLILEDSPIADQYRKMLFMTPSEVNMIELKMSVIREQERQAEQSRDLQQMTAWRDEEQHQRNQAFNEQFEAQQKWEAEQRAESAQRVNDTVQALVAARA